VVGRRVNYKFIVGRFGSGKAGSKES